MKNEDYIYVVKGETGEYSDWHCWEVCASVNEDVANSFCQLLNNRLKELGLTCRASYNKNDFENRQNNIKQMYDLDPKCCVDYTGTSYEVSKVPVLRRV